MALEPRRDEKERPPIPGAAEYMGVGLQFALSILVFLYAGRWLDEKLGTSPWLLMLGVFVGFGAALYSIVRKLGGSGARRDRDREERR
ncbi:MAG TPA: AtpZ/AtpI family protein [Longimicrobiaceae bacterium]|nr:AtpZ/AtpI family protein [Longimicrobiaceae bacterium]